MQATLGLTVTRRLGLRQTLATDLILVAVGSLLVAGFAQVRIPIPFSPVPITGQTFAVLLVGAALGSRRGAASLLLYLAEGSVGLPVFAGGAAGAARLLGPTGGYLVGFVAAAYVIGLFAERGLDRRWTSALPVFLLGNLIIYAAGVAWLARFVGLPQAVLSGVVPFVLLDAVKAVLAAAALPSGWRMVQAFKGPS